MLFRSQEAAVEKRREERKRTEEEQVRPQETDLVQISEAAKAALEVRPVEAAEPVDGDPVVYTETGEIAAVPAETEPTVSFTA